MIEIPYSYKTNQIYDLLHSFIRDFIEELQEVYTIQGAKPKTMWKITALQLRYLWEEPRDNKLLEWKEIGDVVDKSDEAARKETTIRREECIRLLTEDYAYEGIRATSMMKDAFAGFKEELKPVEIPSILQQRLGAGEDERTLAFYLEGLGYKRGNSFYVSVPTFAKNGKSILNDLTVNGGGGKLVRFLKEEATPLRFQTDVLTYMKTKLRWNDTQCQLMEAYMRANTDEFEWSDDGECVGLKWEHLDSVKARQARVIYDFNRENGWDKSISIDQVRARYNALADRFPGIDSLKVGDKVEKHKHIEELGNAHYRYSTDDHGKKDYALLLKTFVAQRGGKAAFDDVVAYILSLNSSYSRQTISQTFVTGAKCSTKVIDGVNYVMSQSYINLHPELGTVGRSPRLLRTDDVIKTSAEILAKENRPLSIREELFQLFLNEKGLDSATLNMRIPGTFANMLHKSEDVLFVFPTTETVELLVDGRDLGSFPFEQYSPQKSGRRSDGTREIVRNLAVEQLYYAPDHILTTRELFEAVKHRFPENRAETGIYKIFRDDPIFVAVGHGRGASYKLDIALYNQEHGIKSGDITTDTFQWALLKKKILEQIKNPHLDDAVCDRMYNIMRGNPSVPFDRNNDFWRILDLLDRYYKGTASDYETEHLTWRLYLGVENYLKAYCPSIDGSGLADTISELQRMGVLPDRYIPNRIGTVEEELRRITGMVIFRRNYIAHNLNHGHDDESSLCDSIKIAIRFYLLVAAYGATKICH